MQRLTLALCVALLPHLAIGVSSVSNVSGESEDSKGSAAQESSPSYSPDVEIWGMQEVTLRSPHSFGNPFADVRLSAIFRCSGAEQNVTGFFDGHNVWKIRYMPSVEGSCSFATKSNDPSLEGFQGKFHVGPPSKDNHGDVRIAKTYHFSYADDTPYFLLGTTLYNWVNRDEALRNETIETLSRSPFTKVRFGLFPKWYLYNHVEPSVYPFAAIGDRKFDFTRFDPRFFALVEEQIRHLQHLGIEADIILFHPYDNWGFAKMSAEQDEAYIRYVVARLSAFRNVWWTMANEYDLFDPAITPGLNKKDWDRMFKALDASDAYHHLRGIHNFADWYDHGKPYISHVLIQDGMGHPGRRIPSARKRYGKPAVVDEYGYEGDNGQSWGNLSGEEEVSRHWEITMAGGYGSHGETYVHPEGILWWAAGGNLVGDSPARLGFLRQVMTGLPFQDLVPSPDVVQGGTVLAVKGEYYLLRVTEQSFQKPVEIDLQEGRRYRVDLLDPWLMKTYELGYTEGGLQAFNPPFFPSLLRFSHVQDSDSARGSRTVQALIAQFLGDPSIATAPAATPIIKETEVYNGQFTLGELMDDSRTAPLLKRFLHLPENKFIRVFSLEQLQALSSSQSLGDVGDIPGLVRELKKIPVQQ